MKHDTSEEWFSVDRHGLAQLLERRGKTWAILELIQNAWDTNATTVRVCLRPVAGMPLVMLTIEDDHPDGFRDLTHAFTLFAPSEKKGDATKRGRFNLGCKLVLAMCRSAKVISTTGAYQFDSKGRRAIRGARREAGSMFEGTLMMTRAELDEVCNQIPNLLPPAGVKTTIEIVGGHTFDLVTRRPAHMIPAKLRTEIADGDGYLRRGERMTTLHVHHAVGQAFLYEIGIPVQPIEGQWSIDVQQKIPMGFDRDAVDPTYVARVQTLTLNAVAEEMTPDQFTAPWVAEAVQNPAVAASAVTGYLTAKYGDKFVVDDPNNRESVREAQAAGYAVIRGGAEAASTWIKIRDHELALPAGQVFPPPAASSNYKTLTDAEIPPGYRLAINYCLELAPKLLGVEIVVRVIDGPTLSSLATWGRTGGGLPPVLTLNLGRLGAGWFSRGPGIEENDIIIHEFAHHYGDHLSKEFDHAMSKLGAQLVAIALADPGFFREFGYGWQQ